MDFQPDPGPQDRINRLAVLLDELLAERNELNDSERKAPTSKMAFNSFKQRRDYHHYFGSLSKLTRTCILSDSSNNQDVFARFYAFENSVMELQRTLQDFSNSVQVIRMTGLLVVFTRH